MLELHQKFESFISRKDYKREIGLGAFIPRIILYL